MTMLAVWFYELNLSLNSIKLAAVRSDMRHVFVCASVWSACKLFATFPTYE